MNNMNSNKHHSRSNNNSKGILEQILETLKEIKFAVTLCNKAKGEAEEQRIPGRTEGDSRMAGLAAKERGTIIKKEECQDTVTKEQKLNILTEKKVAKLSILGLNI